MCLLRCDIFTYFIDALLTTLKHEQLAKHFSLYKTISHVWHSSSNEMVRQLRWKDLGGGKGFRGARLFHRAAASVNFSQAEIRDILLETLLAGDYEVVCC